MAMLLNWHDFAPQKTFGNVWRHFDCHNLARIAAVKYPTLHRTVPTAKIYSAQIPIGQRLKTPLYFLLNNNQTIVTVSRRL